MLLDNATRKLQVVLGEAHTTNALAVVSSFFDSGLTPSGGPALVNTNGVTAVDIVAAPASGYIRQVNELTVFNADTVSHGVTVRYNDNGTTYTIIKATLPPNYTLTYSKALSWTVQSPTGLFVPGQIPGSSTNDNAAAGMVGEYLSITVPSGSPVSVTSGSPANLTSLSLSAGDWDVQAMAETLKAATTTASSWLVTISTTSGVVGTRANGFGVLSQIDIPANRDLGLVTPQVRISLAAPTTIYTVCQMNFAISTATMYGFMSARRVR